MPPVLQKYPQQLLLGFGEFHAPAVTAKVHLFKIEGKGPHGQCLGDLGYTSAQLGIHPGPEYRQREGLGDIVVRTGLQPGLHDSQKLLHVKGLGQIIVGAAVQPQHFVVHFGLGGEQDHRGNITLRPHLTQQVQAAAVGEIHIQNQQVKPVARQRFPGLGQARSADDGCFRPG